MAAIVVHLEDRLLVATCGDVFGPSLLFVGDVAVYALRYGDVLPLEMHAQINFLYFVAISPSVEIH